MEKFHKVRPNISKNQKVILKIVPLFLDSSKCPPICLTRSFTNCKPNDLGFFQSISRGIPIHVSLILSTAFPSSADWRMIKTSPFLDAGNPCFNEFETTSLMIKPKGMALLMSKWTSSISTLNLTALGLTPYVWKRCVARLWI